ncbi:helix-turn-helix domain-containing protein [Leptolyngbya sp. AN03gr2]|uniref:helix-turn-helix domain-containing protein n=1 Tax=unclassified Leptolyngbya TaxID=2650499 RepID=UPI003D32205C
MTITLSQQDYWELVCPEMPPLQPSEAPRSPEVEQIWKYSNSIGIGYYREIQIREGVGLAIAEDYFHEKFKVVTCDREHPLELSYTLIGTATSNLDCANAGQYLFCGSGMAPGEVMEIEANQRNLKVTLHIDPSIFDQWMSGLPKQAPTDIKDWLKPSDQPYYNQVSQMTTAMQATLQQILQCPFQGLTQQMYLEGKVWELIALHLAQSIETDPDRETKPLRSDDIERIHYAKEVLIARLDEPPSLIELARLAGINDCKLKVGFRQVFGTTVFGYLQDYRMERSRQLLESGELSITEAAKAVGLVNRSHFAIAFRKKFGVNPRDYRQSALNRRSIS